MTLSTYPTSRVQVSHSLGRTHFGFSELTLAWRTHSGLAKHTSSLVEDRPFSNVEERRFSAALGGFRFGLQPQWTCGFSRHSKGDHQAEVRRRSFATPPSKGPPQAGYPNESIAELAHMVVLFRSRGSVVDSIHSIVHVMDIRSTANRRPACTHADAISDKRIPQKEVA